MARFEQTKNGRPKPRGNVARVLVYPQRLQTSSFVFYGFWDLLVQCPDILMPICPCRSCRDNENVQQCSCEQLRLFTLMKRRCGVKQGRRKCWFHLQNEIKTRWGDSKNEIGFDVYHIYEHVVITQRCAEAEAEKNEVQNIHWHLIKNLRSSGFLVVMYVICTHPVHRICWVSAPLLNSSYLPYFHMLDSIN